MKTEAKAETKKVSHTPGPWDYCDGFIYFGDGSTEGTETVADIKDTENEYANARLITAAPELLEALKDIHSLLGSGIGCGAAAVHDAALYAEEAIAKAEGR